MPLHPFAQPKGRIETIYIESQALANNILGDPTRRGVKVYLPEGYDESDESYPLLVDIVGYTGSGFGHLNWKSFEENVAQRVDRLVESDVMGPAIFAFPDCFTSLGGNQYINSSVMGNWADYLTNDMITELEARYRILPGRDHRGIFGKSSGGYGSIIHGMLYSDCWGAIACHSGDMAFDLCYLRDFSNTLMHLAKHGDSIEGFISALQSKQKIAGDDFHTLMILAMAATYDPAPELPYGVRLPVSSHTCELDETAWNRWLKWDPVVLVEDEQIQQNLRSLKGLFIDCGSADQYSLVFGARQLRNRLEALDIPHTYQEFPDNHSGIDYRMDVSLPYLYHSLMETK